MLKVPNNSNLSDGQLRTLHKVDSTGAIWPSDREVLPGLHFCPDWDGLAICKLTPEWESCTCDIKKENP